MTWLETVLWAGLAIWLVRLWTAQSTIGSANTAMALCGASFAATAAVIMATAAWPAAHAVNATRLFLWLAFALGLSGVVMWWHHRADGVDGDGGSVREPDPEPPWWPEFERDFRDYERPLGRAQREEPDVGVGVLTGLPQHLSEIGAGNDLDKLVANLLDDQTRV